MTHRQFTILTKNSQRLDQFLAAEFSYFSRSYLTSCIKKGEILINNKQVKPTHKIDHKQQVTLSLLNSQLDILAQDIPLEIIEENSDFLVINKPAGMNVHPVSGEGGNRDTLVNALLHHCRDEQGNTTLGTINGVERPGIVHRLDKDTSGLIIVAKNDPTALALKELFQTRKIKKTYLAQISGHLKDDFITIESDIGRDKHHRKKMTTVNSINPKHAITHIKTLEKYSEPLPYSLVEVTIETGRTHQIRVHSEALGHPILGDTLYGNTRANELAQKHLGVETQRLHAWKLEFTLFTNQWSFEVSPEWGIE